MSAEYEIYMMWCRKHIQHSQIGHVKVRMYVQRHIGGCWITHSAVGVHQRHDTILFIT